MKFGKTLLDWDVAYNNYLKCSNKNKVFPATQLQFFANLHHETEFNYWFNYKEEPEKEYKFGKTKEEWEKAFDNYKKENPGTWLTLLKFYNEITDEALFNLWFNHPEAPQILKLGKTVEQWSKAYNNYNYLHPGLGYQSFFDQVNNNFTFDYWYNVLDEAKIQAAVVPPPPSKKIRILNEK